MSRRSTGAARWLPLLLTVLAAPAGAAPLEVPRKVVAQGGQTGASPAYGLRGTVGQSAVGLSEGSGRRVGHGFWQPGGAAVLGVTDPPPGGPAVPTRLELGPATPNPARAGTRFRLALPAEARIRFGLFDLQGRAVGDLATGTLAAGWHDLVWRPTPDHAGAGVLFARLEVDGRLVATRRVVVTR
jgi:hypothetical protein